MNTAMSLAREERRPKIVVVDDESSYRDLFDLLLSPRWDVECFGRAEPALERLREGNVDLLIVDLRMPGSLNGFMIASEARRLWPDLPCILVSGYVDSEDLQQRQIYDRYCDACFTKPFPARDLLSRVELLLSDREGRGAVPGSRSPGR